MAEPGTRAARPASGTVHWLGAGLSTGSGLGAVAGQAASVVLWSRNLARAEDRREALGLSGSVHARALSWPALAGAVAPGDVVVSMVPATEHPTVLRLCLDAGAHFACSSYTSPELAAAAPAATAAGLAVLTEAGLDPGIDHLLALQLAERGRAAAGDAATAAFGSYCGGLPAVPNEFRYRFSWAPRAVLSALRQPARYLDDGRELVADHPWEAVRPLVLAGETFEVYPNRDSMPFLQRYGFPPGWRLRTFIRGTLRLDGWRAAWSPVFTELVAGDPARIDELADELARRHPMTAQDRDRVVLAVELTLQDGAGTGWSGRYLLDALGTAQETAMARCVSLPLAAGVLDVLAGRAAPGLRQAAEDPATAARWLAFLAEHGITAAYTESTGGTAPPA